MSEHTLRVLLVDDNVRFRANLKKILESKHGFQVINAASGAEAQAYLIKTRGAIDVAVLDECLEGEISGSELLQWIKAHYPAIEVIVYTAWGMENALKALHAGAFRYLTKPINPEELALMVRHAAEVGQLRSAAREKDVLANLMMVSTALLSGHEEDEILEVALQAIHAIGFDRVRLYELQQDGAVLRARAHVGMADSFLDACWSTAEDDLMQQVLRDPQVTLFRRQPGEKLPYEDFLDKGDVDEWICAPLVVDGKVVGKLSADKKHSRAPITEAEKGPLALFTSMAAMAIENNRLLATTRRRADELEMLRKNTLAITANLEREALLKTIIQGAVELLGARRGGIYEYHPQKGLLEVVADYGHGVSTRGQTLKEGEGLAGRLVISSEEYRITPDYASWPGRSERYNPDEFHAVVEVPLIWEEQRTGVLYVEDALGRQFSSGDAHLLSRFAGYAAIALEQARRMGEIKLARDGFARVIESSFDGIITAGMDGRIREINSQAEQILDVPRGKVIGRPVTDFYFDPGDAHRIARRLYTSPSGRLVDHSTHLKNCAGEKIPVRLSATWLFDARGERSGSVGYFKDLRYVQKLEHHRTLLLEANEAVARAGSLEEGLKALAERMTAGCGSTFGAIYLHQPEPGRLQVKAAHSVQRVEELAWDWHGDGQGLSDQHRLFQQVAAQAKTLLLNDQDPQEGELLDEIAANVRLAGGLGSALIVPLSLGGVVRGMCVLGEMRNWERQPFGPDEIRLVESLTSDAAALLEKMQLQELTTQQLAESERQKRLWETLAQSLRYIHPARERDQLQQEIANQVADLMEYSYACLLIYHPLYEQLEITRVLELPEDLKGTWIPADRQPFREALRNGDILRLEDISQAAWCATVFGDVPVSSALVIPFHSAAEPVAVLVLGDVQPHSAHPADLDVIRRFSTQAVTALQTSDLIDSEKRKIAQLMLLRKISEYIQQPVEDLHKIFDAALTGVTAGYGLCFNRAAILLKDPLGEKLIGRKGIGHLDKKSAEADWANYLQEGMDDVNRFLERLEGNELTPTPLDAQIHGLEILIYTQTEDPLSEVMALRLPMVLSRDDIERLPENFIQAFQPGDSFTVAPLIARQQVIGLLVADNAFTCMPVSEDLLESLMTFADAIAMAVDNAQMILDLKRGQSFQRALFEASGELLSDLDTREMLNRIVRQGRKAAEAYWVSLLLVDERGKVEVLASDGLDLQVDPGEIIRRDGITEKIMRSGLPEVIHAVQERQDSHPRLKALGIQAAAGLPVILNGNPIGVMWVHYQAPHHFTPNELQALQLYANQAALALNEAYLIEDLQRAKTAVEEVAKVMALGDFEATLKLLVESTRHVTGCNAVVLYTLDEETGILDYPPTMDGVWFPERAKRFTRVTPESIVYKMLEQDSLYKVENVAADEFFRDSRFTIDEEVQAVVAVPLVAYGKKKGIMFVNYRQPQTLTEATLDNIELFAHQAAIAVHNAKLYQKEKQTVAELEKTKAMLDGRQALAFMGIINNTFRHTLDTNIQTIVDNVDHIVMKSKRHSFDEQITDQIQLIRKVVADVRSMPLNAPLSKEEGISPFSLSDLVRERLSQKRETYAGVEYVAELVSDADSTVVADRQWVRRALDILLDNAVEAMQDDTQKVLTVRVEKFDERVEVRIMDTGPGIRAEIRPLLFKTRIPKENYEKGQGIGLLLALMIFQAYLGDLDCENTGSGGTTMLGWLPAA